VSAAAKTSPCVVVSRGHAVEHARSLRPSLARFSRVTDSPTPPAETQFITVGRVGRPHGLDGSFFVEDASKDPERFEPGATLYVAGEPVEVSASKRGSGGRPVIRLDRDVPRGTELAVRRDELPPPGEGEYYAFQLVGLEVEEEGGRRLGRVSDVAPGIANDVLELDSGVGLPLVAACVRDIDLERRRIVVASGFAAPPLP
jgi:16S rRNA processing protein RimM